MASSGLAGANTSAQDLVKSILFPERSFIRIAIVYSLAISLLTLAVPIAVQTLINTVVNIASVTAVITLSVLLFITLALSGLFSALRVEIMEKYERHIYARLTAEISARTLMSDPNYFDGRRNLDITNRYFDINTFQKNLPPLLIDGFTLCLQMLVGFTLVSFYHPALLAFCLIFVFCLYFIWMVWGKKAIRTAVELSHAKYYTAKWLGDLASANSFFKSSSHIEYARQQTEKTTAHFIQEHKDHFKFTFTQTICLLLLYAAASSSLLGVGGVLVINGELSIGQLVAAELILTAIFFGLSQSATYLKQYYELCGAADELGQVFSIPIEKHDDGQLELHETSGSLEFNGVEIEHAGNTHRVSFKVEVGAKIFISTSYTWLQRSMIYLLKNNIKPKSGWIRLADKDLRDYNTQQLRQSVTVIDRSLFVECQIYEFMRMSAPQATIAEIQDALELVGLAEIINQLPDGINTQLSPVGTPLNPSEFLLLKLAAAILSKAKVVILTQYFDHMMKDALIRLLEKLQDLPFIMLYFTNHADLQVLDYCLFPDLSLKVDETNS